MHIRWRGENKPQRERFAQRVKLDTLRERPI